MDRRRSLMRVSESGGNNVFAITLYEGDSNEDTVLLYNSLVAKSTFNGSTWVTPLDDFEIVFVGARTSYFDGVIISATYVSEYNYFIMKTQKSVNIANIFLDSSGLVSLSIYG